MPHMVIYRDPEGQPAYHQTDALEGAVRFVERLRNEQHVTEARIFAMQEVPIEFKTYYRVEVPVGEVADVPSAPAPAPQVTAEAPFAGDAPLAAPVETGFEPVADSVPLAVTGAEAEVFVPGPEPLVVEPVAATDGFAADVTAEPLAAEPVAFGDVIVDPSPVAANGSGRFGLFGRT